MFLFSIFSKMKRRIRHKVVFQEPGLYMELLSPISVAFLLTFGVARIISYYAPNFVLILDSGLHIHHFAYGFMVLAAAGYLALIFDEAPRAKYLISLLYGFGLGMVFDEMGMWLNLREDDIARWSYDGFVLVTGLVLFILTIVPGVRLLKRTWPFRPQNEPKIEPAAAPSDVEGGIDFTP